MHETAVVHVFERHCHIDQNIADVLVQDRIVAAMELFQVRAFHVFHQQIKRSINFSMLEVTDYVLVIVNAAEDLATADKTFAGCKIESRSAA